jgi:hypothetical protein
MNGRRSINFALAIAAIVGVIALQGAARAADKNHRVLGSEKRLEKVLDVKRLNTRSWDGRMIRAAIDDTLNQKVSRLDNRGERRQSSRRRV